MVIHKNEGNEENGGKLVKKNLGLGIGKKENEEENENNSFDNEHMVQFFSGSNEIKVENMEEEDE